MLQLMATWHSFIEEMKNDILLCSDTFNFKIRVIFRLYLVFACDGVDDDDVCCIYFLSENKLLLNSYF